MSSFRRGRDQTRRKQTISVRGQLVKRAQEVRTLVLAYLQQFVVEGQILKIKRPDVVWISKHMQARFTIDISLYGNENKIIVAVHRLPVSFSHKSTSRNAYINISVGDASSKKKAVDAVQDIMVNS